MASIAPTIHAKTMLEYGVDSEENCFLILPDKEAYDKCIRIINFLKIYHTLHIHLNPISPENSTNRID